MELTKKEQKILSPNYEKKLTRFLWMGILLFCISGGILIFAIIQKNNFETHWDKTQLALAEEIVPVTKQEVQMKTTLLENLTDTKQIYAKYANDKFQYATKLCFLSGCYLVGYYFSSRTYMKLIQKLIQPPNNRLHTDAE